MSKKTDKAGELNMKANRTKPDITIQIKGMDTILTYQQAKEIYEQLAHLFEVKPITTPYIPSLPYIPRPYDTDPYYPTTPQPKPYPWNYPYTWC